MRTRWLLLVLALSVAANVLLGTAFWQSRRAAVAAPAGMACAPSPEEMQAREELASLLCAERPDRAEITACLSRLDAARSKTRDAAVERWLSECSHSGRRDVLVTSIRHQLCPWRNGGAGCCAPSPAAGSPHPPAQPR